jgi:hypothetical protein
MREAPPVIVESPTRQGEEGNFPMSNFEAWYRTYYTRYAYTACLLVFSRESRRTGRR